MPKTHGLPALDLGRTNPADRGQQTLSPPLSPRSPGSLHSASSNPGTPRLGDLQARSMFAQATNGVDVPPSQPQPLSPTHPPASPQMKAPPVAVSNISDANSKHGRDPSKSFFLNLMASKSSHRLHSPDASLSDNAEKPISKSRASSKDRNFHGLRSKGSTPELPRLIQNSESMAAVPSDGGLPVTRDEQANDELQTSANASKKSKSRIGGILNRTKSTRLDDSQKFKARSPTHLNIDTHATQATRNDPHYSPPIQTAPIPFNHREKAFGADTNSSTRNRSADRHHKFRQEDPNRKERFPKTLAVSQSFMNGISHTGRGVGDRFGKVGKGLFERMTRSGSTTERDLVTDDNYVCTVINLPLVKQTRKTRIARRLERSKDKTEFWMPALPWRCIDYLNMNGCEEEGLYRIPGSNRDVKRWQRRFDTLYDINLFDEEELYDINTIGSMFKSWLRDLPDEIFPKKTQAKIAQECAGATKTPKLLKDELSKLPPFNYYLLFAITCHLSLLHSFSDKNKMDYRNLCICFQPCLRIDGFCFQFLVQDWKSCWQGCWTEKEYLEEEYRYEREGSTHGSDDDRAVSSSGSSQTHAQQQAVQQAVQQQPSQPSQQSLPRIENNGTSNNQKAPLPKTVRRKASSSASTSLATAQVNGNHDKAGDVTPAVSRSLVTPEPQIITTDRLPELKGLSPIKF